jgi:hypothetical protein
MRSKPYLSGIEKATFQFGVAHLGCGQNGLQMLRFESWFWPVSSNVEYMYRLSANGSYRNRKSKDCAASAHLSAVNF